jgi:hypothetical protein
MIFSSPQSVSFQYSADGTQLIRMYVVDTYNSTIQIINPNINVATSSCTPVFIGFLGDYGFNSAAGELHLPVDAGFDKLRKRLFVVNGKGEVVSYGIDGGVAPVATYTPPPGLTLNLPYNVVNSDTLTIGGTVAAGSTVSCVLNKVPVVVWNAAGNAWSCTFDKLLKPNADNDIEVYAQNASPVTDVKSASVKYLVSGPSIKVGNVPDYYNFGSLPIAGETDGTTVEVCNPKVSANYCVGAVVNTTAKTWSVAGVNLIEGSNAGIIVKATKNAVEATQLVHPVFYDNSSPVMKVSVVPHDSVVNGQIQNISGQVTDAEGMLDSVVVNSYDYSTGKEVVTTQNATVVKNGIFSAVISGVTAYNVVATDKAGNKAIFPPASSGRTKNTINYDPNRVKVWLTGANVSDASVVTTPYSQSLTGKYDKTLKSLTVNGHSATLNDTDKTWSVIFNLFYDSAKSDGFNDIQIVAEEEVVDPQTEVVTTFLTKSKVTLECDPANPEATIVEPKFDVATKLSAYTMSAMDGTAVILTTTFQGKTESVASMKDFSVGFVGEGAYPVVLSAKDSNGAFSQIVRNIIYDKTMPVIDYLPKYSSIECATTVAGSCPSKCPGSIEAGVCLQSVFAGTVEAGATVALFNASANTPISQPVVYSNGGRSWSVDLVAGTMDPFNTLVVATDAAGNERRSFPVAPDGNILIDGSLNKADSTRCMELVSSFGPKVKPAVGQLTPQELAHGDIGPLKNGKANPDGYLDIVDCQLIIRKLNGYTVLY